MEAQVNPIYRGRYIEDQAMLSLAWWMRRFQLGPSSSSYRWDVQAARSWCSLQAPKKWGSVIFFDAERSITEGAIDAP
jgi:hypothetical protein